MPSVYDHKLKISSVMVDFTCHLDGSQDAQLATKHYIGVLLLMKNIGDGGLSKTKPLPSVGWHSHVYKGLE